MDTDIKRDIDGVVNALKSNRFDPVVFVEKAEDAKKMVLDMIPPDSTFVVAGSTTVSQLGLTELMMKWATQGSGLEPVSIEEMMRRGGDVLVCSSNAITLDGKLVNIDGAGNRVANMIFGPKKVILIIGLNKVVRDVDEALHRIKHIIAPYHANAIGYNTPCAKTGQCNDCNSPERICNITTVIEKKPSMTDMAVILVGEDLGLGWNPDWDETRIELIKTVYRAEIEKFMSKGG